MHWISCNFKTNLGRSIGPDTKSCLTLCNPMDCSRPGFPVLHYLPEFAQTNVHWVDDAIQPTHPLLSPSPPAINASQHQSLFQWASSLLRWPKYWSFNFRTSASVFPMNIQGWFPLGFTGLISLQSKGLPGVFSSITVWKHQFLHGESSLCYNPHIHTWLLEKPQLKLRTFVRKVTSLLFNMLCRLVIAFLPWSKRLLNSWLQSPSTVILELRKIKSVTVSFVSPSICHEVMGPDATNFIFWTLNFKPTCSVCTIG